MDLPIKWRELINENQLNECIKRLPTETIPRRELIFRAFTYFDPQDCKFVILGQDPYPSVEDACGLSFSTQKKRLSITKIFKRLIDTGHLETMPDNGHLECWAERGVLLLNTMLTYSEKKDTFWFEFTDKLLYNLVMANPNITIFAWGEDAKKRVAHLPLTNIIPYHHPAARTATWEFNGFNEVNPKFTEMGGWSTKRFVRIYTDGACSQNGRYNAKAGWACVFHNGLNNQPFLKLYGRLYEYDFIYANNKLLKGTKVIPATNNRGEFYAIVVALLKIYKLYGPCVVEIITDSMLAINTASKWMFNWFPNFEAKKNPDLVSILYNVSQLHKISYTYQEAHLDNPQTPNEIGNAEADRLAVMGKSLDHFNILTLQVTN